MFEYYGNIHAYCPGVGADEPLGSNFLNQSIGFREEDIRRVFTIYGHGSHLGHVTYIINVYIGSPIL